LTEKILKSAMNAVKETGIVPAAKETTGAVQVNAVQIPEEREING